MVSALLAVTWACKGADQTTAGSASSRAVDPPIDAAAAAARDARAGASSDAAAVDAGPMSWTITATSVGGITSATPATRESLGTLFPGLTFSAEESNAEGDPTYLVTG